MAVLAIVVSASRFFLFQSFLQKIDGIIKGELFRNVLGCGESAGDSLYSSMISAPSSVMPTIAAQVLPCGFLSMAANTYSSRSIWPAGPGATCSAFVHLRSGRKRHSLLAVGKWT